MVDKLAIAAAGSLAAYERAWTLSEIPIVPAALSELFRAHGIDSTDSGKSVIVPEGLGTFPIYGWGRVSMPGITTMIGILVR